MTLIASGDKFKFANTAASQYVAIQKIKWTPIAQSWLVIHK